MEPFHEAMKTITPKGKPSALAMAEKGPLMTTCPSPQIDAADNDAFEPRSSRSPGEIKAGPSPLQWLLNCWQRPPSDDDLEADRDRIRQLEAEVARLSSEVSTTQKALTSAQAALHEVRDKYEEAHAQVVELQVAQQDMEAEANEVKAMAGARHQGSQQRLEQLRREMAKEIARADRSAAEKEALQAKLQQQSEDSAARIKQLQEELEVSRQDIAEAATVRRSMEEQLETLTKLKDTESEHCLSLTPEHKLALTPQASPKEEEENVLAWLATPETPHEPQPTAKQSEDSDVLSWLATP